MIPVASKEFFAPEGIAARGEAPRPGPGRDLAHPAPSGAAPSPQGGAHRSGGDLVAQVPGGRRERGVRARRPQSAWVSGGTYRRGGAAAGPAELHPLGVFRFGGLPDRSFRRDGAHGNRQAQGAAGAGLRLGPRAASLLAVAGPARLAAVASPPTAAMSPLPPVLPRSALAPFVSSAAVRRLILTVVFSGGQGAASGEDPLRVRALRRQAGAFTGRPSPAGDKLGTWPRRSRSCPWPCGGLCPG